MTTDCCVCGVEICLSPDQTHELRRTYKNFYCPAGHSQHFTEGCEHELTLKSERAIWARTRDRLSHRIAELSAEARSCPWPTCRRRPMHHVYASRRALLEHLERVHGMPKLAALRVEEAS